MSSKKVAPCSGQAGTARDVPFAVATDARGVTGGRGPRQHHETADNYGRVVTQPGEGWRVIECKDRLQWILQRRDALRAGQPRWAGTRYCQSKAALIRASRALCGQIESEAMEKLNALPDRIGGGA